STSTACAQPSRTTGPSSCPPPRRTSGTSSWSVHGPQPAGNGRSQRIRLKDRLASALFPEVGQDSANHQSEVLEHPGVALGGPLFKGDVAPVWGRAKIGDHPSPLRLPKQAGGTAEFEMEEAPADA